MRYTIQQITTGEEEVILRYRERTSEVERICSFLQGKQQRLRGWKEQQLILFEPEEVLYIESVDGKTFAYTKQEVLQTEYTLNRLEQLLTGVNFFRCSKSMIINIDHVERLKSLPSNRIEATMCGGERIMISRTFASDFRKILRGGDGNE